MKEKILIAAMFLLILAITQVRGQIIELQGSIDLPIDSAYYAQFKGIFGGINEDGALYTGNVKKWIKQAIDTLGREKVYVVSESNLAQLINTGKIIVSSEYVNILLEPIPGKVTRWEITRREEIQVPDSVVTVLDNTNLTYTGTWVPAVNNNLPFLNKTFHYSSAINAYLELKFTGRRVEWWGERNLSHGRAEVSIDGVVDKVVNPSGEGADIVRGKPSYFKTWPVSGDHTIKIRVVEGKSVLVDFLRTVR